MALNKNLGNLGEHIAREHLIAQGYAIIDTNWRMGKSEADIIAYMEGLLVFVEVKTRSNTDFASPESAVDRAKQRTYVRLANAYVLQNRREEEVRFDIITVVIDNTDHPQVNHILNAFSAAEI